MTDARQRARALTEGPLLTAILRLSAPSMVLAAVQGAAMFADVWLVGRLGTEPLAGLALVFPLMALMQMMSAGALGGGVSSAIARALGRGDADEAGRLAVQALWVAGAFAALFTATMLLFGERLFFAMGGRGAALEQAVLYARIVFGGAACVWCANVLANVVRGTGSMRVPALTLAAAGAAQVPLAALLVLGAGPFEGLGIAGAGIAYVVAFGAAALVLAVHVFGGAAGLRVRPAGWAPQWRSLREILRVGGLASLNAIQTILATLILTGLAGSFGTAVLAGYGLGARLELLQVPFVFAIGSALVAIVGVNVGAGQLARAERAAWIGGGLAAAASGMIGIVVAVRPDLWAGLFSDDPAVLAAAYAYLSTVGPCYAFLGGGFALYFASQGVGRVAWPVLAASARLLIAGLGGWLAVVMLGRGLDVLYLLIALAMAAFGVGVAASIRWRVFRALPGA